MKVMITTRGGDISLHNKIVDLMNKIYDIKEIGSNGGFGYYFTHADTDYPHITTPFRVCNTFGHVEISIETLGDEEEEEEEE